METRTLLTPFTNKDINEIYNDVIIYSILNYQQFDEETKEYFLKRYNHSCSLLKTNNIDSKSLEITDIYTIKNKLDTYKSVYDNFININNAVINDISKDIERIILSSISKKDDELSRISYLFDFITSYITYSEDYYNYCIKTSPTSGYEFDFKNNLPINVYKSIEELLVIGQGVCEEISNLMVYLGKKLNLNIETVGCTYKGEKHSINKITLKNGNTYLIDATRLIRKDKTKEACFLVSTTDLNKESNYVFNQDLITTTYKEAIPSFKMHTDILINNLGLLRPQIENLSTNQTKKIR